MNPQLKVNIFCVKLYYFYVNLYFDMIYFTHLYFNLPFGFANPATQIQHFTLGYSMLKCTVDYGYMKRSWMNSDERGIVQNSLCLYLC